MFVAGSSAARPRLHSAGAAAGGLIQEPCSSWQTIWSDTPSRNLLVPHSVYFSLCKNRMQSSACLNGSPRPRLHTQSDSINRLRGQAHLTQKCKTKKTDIFMGFSRCINTFCFSVQAYRFDSDNKSLFDL